MEREVYEEKKEENQVIPARECLAYLITDSLSANETTQIAPDGNESF